VPFIGEKADSVMQKQRQNFRLRPSEMEGESEKGTDPIHLPFHSFQRLGVYK
jgi:hypothetical protein